MLGLQCYAKIKVTYAGVVIMVTRDEYRSLTASMMRPGAIAELVE